MTEEESVEGFCCLFQLTVNPAQHKSRVLLHWQICSLENDEFSHSSSNIQGSFCYPKCASFTLVKTASFQKGLDDKMWLGFVRKPIFLI